MPRNTRNKSELLELDVDKLFEQRSIDEIIEIEKLLDAEIERKRGELRSMVGDRYKDVLAASDAIISMKTISQEIVNNIEKITDICEQLIASPISTSVKPSFEVEQAKIDERRLVIQIRLAIFMNEQIWIALDEESNLEAAQYYLLAQHIHTGLSLLKKERLDNIPLLLRIKTNLVVLRSKIFQKITEKLQSVEITAQESSSNMNSLLLLENQSCNDLLSIFIEHRKTALYTVINSTYSSIKIQVGAMVRCLITTVHLLHDCFICTESAEKGLIWLQLHDIISDTAPTTLSKLELPITPLITYIPEIIKQFRPQCKSAISAETSLKDANNVLEQWLQSTQESVIGGLEKSLKLVPNIKGLHFIREEALKIDVPSNWDQICSETHLPENFDVWYYFFQDLISRRCHCLISKKVLLSVEEVQKYITGTLIAALKSNQSEADLRWYVWTEEQDDVSKSENKHKGLAMKTKGYSQNVVELCEKMDRKYLELLEDVMQYLNGKEYAHDDSFSVVLKDFKFKRKYTDKPDLQNHLRTECTNTSAQITDFIKSLLDKETDHLVTKSIFCARFLQAIPQLCPNFTKCCTFNTTEDWLKICDTFNKTSHLLWQNWVSESTESLAKISLNDTTPSDMIKILSRWDQIEIQEQTEEKVFKSQIKVPLKPSLSLSNVLLQLNDKINCVLPHTLPKSIHIQFIESSVRVILNQYKRLLDRELNQIQALQFLFDVKFVTTLCIPRENVQLTGSSQDICEALRGKIDPFDLDVFYSYLQNNVKRAVVQSQIIFGCLMPSSVQLASLGVSEKNREQEKSPSILAVSVPSSTSWFPLLPITAPSQKTTSGSSLKKNAEESSQKVGKASPKRAHDPASIMRQSAASLFGGLTTDWFS